MSSLWAAQLDAAEGFFDPEAIRQRLHRDFRADWARSDNSDPTPQDSFLKLHLFACSRHLSGDAPLEWPERAKTASLWRSVQSGGLVCLLGQRGSGKTQAVCLMCVAGGVRAIYMPATDLAGHLKSWVSIPGGVIYAKNIRQLQQCPLLVLDDVHDLAFTEFEGRAIIGILNLRYAERRPTILISNDDTIQSLANRIGSTLLDRTKEHGAIITFDWPSFRGKP